MTGSLPRQPAQQVRWHPQTRYGPQALPGAVLRRMRQDGRVPQAAQSAVRRRPRFNGKACTAGARQKGRPPRNVRAIAGAQKRNYRLDPLKYFVTRTVVQGRNRCAHGQLD